MTYLDRLATQATGHGFTPTLGYGLARPHQLPAAAWVQARAFTRYDPAVCRHPQLRVWWAVLRWPDLRLGERLLMLGWMAGVLLLPRALAGRLARQHRRLSGRETPTC